MRYVPVKCLRPGQKLASDLRMYDKSIFIRQNIPLTTRMIRRVQSLGLQGVYIEDDISKDLYVANIISEGLQRKAKKEIRSLFIDAECKKENRISVHIATMDGVVKDMVDEILHNKNVMVNIIDIRTFDDYTFSHSLNVAVLSVVIGTVLNLDRKQLRELAMGALIHDIGKVFIDKRILDKPGKLTSEEMNEIKKHSRAGYDYIKSNCMIPADAAEAILTHHEQFNGSGYPLGLKKEEIHFFGRIISVADVYDALTSDRTYRSALMPADAVEYIMSGYESMFDPKVVSAFIRKVAPFPVGTRVRLSNGITGIVVENYESYGLRPKIRVIEGEKPTEEVIDLAHDKSTLNLTVQQVLNG